MAKKKKEIKPKTLIKTAMQVKKITRKDEEKAEKDDTHKEWLTLIDESSGDTFVFTKNDGKLPSGLAKGMAVEVKITSTQTTIEEH